MAVLNRVTLPKVPPTPLLGSPQSDPPPPPEAHLSYVHPAPSNRHTSAASMVTTKAWMI